MKCPYRNFDECIIQECPACDYETEEYEAYEGMQPATMSTNEAFEHGYIWKAKRKRYVFKGCKLINKAVQPVPKSETNILNENHIRVGIQHSIF